MRHARDAALDGIDDLLTKIRVHPSLTERKRGSFYRRSAGFVHFHEDPAGMFADLKMDDGWQRFRVTTRSEQKQFLAEVSRVLRKV